MCEPTFDTSAVFLGLGLSHPWWPCYWVSDNATPLLGALLATLWLCVHVLLEKQVSKELSSARKCGNTLHGPLLPITSARAHWNQTITAVFWLGPSNSGNCQGRCLGLCRASLILYEVSSAPGQSWKQQDGKKCIFVFFTDLMCFFPFFLRNRPLWGNIFFNRIAPIKQITETRAKL